MPLIIATVNAASIIPMLTPVCRTAAIQGRQFFGQVSDSSEAPTAHSPPIPRAARNRKINRCHQVCAKYDNPVNMAYVRIVSIKALLRPIRSPTTPKNPPPNAHPTRNAA
jgi:hypothetical protein